MIWFNLTFMLSLTVVQCLVACVVIQAVYTAVTAKSKKRRRITERCFLFINIPLQVRLAVFSSWLWLSLIIPWQGQQRGVGDPDLGKRVFFNLEKKRVRKSPCLLWEVMGVFSFESRVVFCGPCQGVLNFHVGTPKPEGNAWVERRSCEVALPNDIKHVFFYILETGQKTSKVYGKFLLHSKFTSCSWSRVVLDSSIVGELRDELAGMVLGVAALSDSAQEQPDLGGFGGFGDGVQYFGEDQNFFCATSLDSMEEAVSYQVKSKEKRMPFFCHVDLLAARNLIPADADGLADPYYELWIEKHRVQSPDPARRSLNPNFMHRVVVGPIDLEVDVHGEIQHLPPVILRILDKDTWSCSGNQHPHVRQGRSPEAEPVAPTFLV